MQTKFYIIYIKKNIDSYFCLLLAPAALINEERIPTTDDEKVMIIYI